MKKLNYYVCSSFNNKAQVRETYKRLNVLGWNLALDWTNEEPSISVPERREKAVEEAQAVKGSDFVVILLPTRNGSQSELGIALASALDNPDKKIFVWAERDEDLYYLTGEDHGWYRNVFYYHPRVKVLKCSYERLIEILEEEGRYWRNSIKECCRP